MANTKLQYQATSKTIGIITGVVTVVYIGPFSDFTQPILTKNAATQAAQVVNTPIGQTYQTTVFSSFSQPQFNRTTIVDEQPSPLFEVRSPPIVIPIFTSFSQPQFSRLTLPNEQPSPIFEAFVPPAYDAGTPIFSTFGMVLRVPLPVSVSFQNFVHITPPDPPVQELHDGGYVKKKRKLTKRELDPYAEEAEIKRKRREAIELAVYGPPVEYTLPPLVFPPSPPAPPQLGDLPQIMLAAQQRKVIEARLKQIQDEEDELEQILKDIL